MGGRNDKVEVIHSSHIRDFSWFVLINQCMWVREEGYAQSTLWCAVNEFPNLAAQGGGWVLERHGIKEHLLRARVGGKPNSLC